MADKIQKLNWPAAEGIQKVISEKGIQKQYVAEQLGITKNSLSAMLHGRKVLTPNVIADIAEILGVNAGEFFENSKNKAPLETSRALDIQIGEKKYQRIIIVGKDDEVLAMITSDKVIEKDEIRCIFKN